MPQGQGAAPIRGAHALCQSLFTWQCESGAVGVCFNELPAPAETRPVPAGPPSKLNDRPFRFPGHRSAGRSRADSQLYRTIAGIQVTDVDRADRIQHDGRVATHAAAGVDEEILPGT